MNFILKNFFHLIKRFKTSSFLIIVGLSISFAVFITVIMQVHYDLGYDRSYSNSEKIFKFSRLTPASGDEWQTITQQLAAELKEKLPEIEAYCLTGHTSTNNVTKEGEPDSSGENLKVASTEVTPGFLEVFTPEIIQGDPAPDFNRKEVAIISEKSAHALFGDESPVGKVIYVTSSERDKNPKQLIISSVYKDFPKNSSVANGLYTYMEENTPNNWNYNGFFLINPRNKQQIEERLNSEEVLGAEAVKFFRENPDRLVEFKLNSFKDQYLYGTDKNRRINTTLSLLAVGIVVIVIALINFINFSVAMSPARVRNINIHKILGIKKRLLQFAVTMEGVLYALISLLLAIVYLYLLQGSPLITTFVPHFDLPSGIGLIIVCGFGLMSVAFVAGIYPAHYTTSFNEAFALKGSFAMSPVGVKLRNTLITIQFIAAIVLITFSSFIKLQNDYMQNYDWGLQKENIIYLDIHNLKTDPKTFGEELMRNPNILNYTVSGFMPGRVGMSWGRDFEGKYIDYFHSWPVAYNFLDFFGVKIIAGTNFTETTGDSLALEQIIFNQKFLDKNELDYDIVGKKFPCFKTGIIRGVVDDINFESLHESIKPMAFVVLDKSPWYNNNLFVKVSGHDLKGTIEYIENIWPNFNNDSFSFSFLDDEMNKLYEQEINTAILIGFFGAVSILIAIMGIYGLILFNTRYKRKEIAIRKINGSSEWNIVLMLNKGLLILLAVGFVIACPLAYYFASKWLGSFAYRIPVYPWVFILSGLLVAMITVVTVSWQSWRAATANPVDALKNE